MKNPWMSAWLSAANRMTAAARGQMTAQMRKAQKQARADWGRIVTGKAGKTKRKT